MREDATRWDFVVHVHSYLQSQISLADTKAGVVSGIAAGLFVAYREITGDWLVATSPEAVDFVRALLQVPFLFFVLMSVVHGYVVIAPRMPDVYRRAALGLEPLHRGLEHMASIDSPRIDLAGGGELVRWPEIADRTRYPTTMAYANSVESTDTQRLVNNVAEHSAILARIAAHKYEHVRLAVNYALLSGLTVAVLSLLGSVKP